MSFANLKRNRGSVDKLIAAVEASSGGSGGGNKFKDDRKWKPAIDKMGNGYAVIRFLPAGEGQASPFEKYWDHGFKGPTGKWYIEKSLTSLDQDDPVSEMNSRLWNMVDDDNSPTRKQARAQKRRLHYVSNVLVISDPANPHNEGKVFIYEYGKKIFDMIKDAMKPQYADETPINPFDFWDGADFKIKIRKVEGWVNYDKSEFSSAAALSEDEAFLEGIYNSMHPIQECIDPSTYKSYDELKKKLDAVLGAESQHTMKEQSSLGSEAPAYTPREMPAKTAAELPSDGGSMDAAGAEADDSMSYFASLVNGD